MTKQTLKTTAAFLMAMLLGSTLIWAQPGPNAPGMSREKIERLKIAFITEELDLSVEEGQQFWPLYNEFNDFRSDREQLIRRTYRDLKGPHVDESDVLRALEVVRTARQEMVGAEDQYFKDVLQVLGAEKTVQLADMERRFREEILKKLQERQQRNGPRPGFRGR